MARNEHGNGHEHGHAHRDGHGHAHGDAHAHEHGDAPHHAHGHVPGHVPGTMDISEHERTFHGFLKGVMWVVIVTITILIFLALVNA